MNRKPIAEFDELGAFELKEQVLDLVAGGGVSILSTTSTPTDAYCLNGVCLDGNTACATVNPVCGGVPNVQCGPKINPACFPNPNPQTNTPCATNRTCHIP